VRTNSHADRHRDRFTERDRDEHTGAHGNVNQHADIDRDCDDHPTTEYDRNACTYADRDGNAHSRRTQCHSERGTNLRGLDRQKACRHLRDVPSTGNRIEMGLRSSSISRWVVQCKSAFRRPAG
jgi:hypothetical protein